MDSDTKYSYRYFYCCRFLALLAVLAASKTICNSLFTGICFIYTEFCQAGLMLKSKEGELLENYLNNLTPQRIITLVVCVAIIVIWIRFKWSRASRYVEGRNELHSDHYRKLYEYTLRVMQDHRWPGLFSEMQSRYSVVNPGSPCEDETYQVHYASIYNDIGRQYEPNEQGAEFTFVSVYLKRKAKPKYINFVLSPAGELTESSVKGGQWYDMFEKSV